MSVTPHSPHGEDQPVLSYGELRRRLEEMGNPWTVDPLISNDEPVPQFPTGGQLAGTKGAAASATRIDPGADIRELIAELPPNDPALREHWTEAGVPLDRKVSEATTDRLPEEPPDEEDPRTPRPRDQGDGDRL